MSEPCGKDHEAWLAQEGECPACEIIELRAAKKKLKESLEDFIERDHLDETCPEKLFPGRYDCRVCHAKRVLAEVL